MTTNDCHGFVGQLLAAADAVMDTGEFDARPARLADRLIDVFVPSMSVAGIDLKKLLGQNDAHDRPGVEPVVPDVVRGFRPELVSGGQDGESIRHFAAAAAAVLRGRAWLVPAAIIVDAGQALVRGSVAEARAEIADDRAGAAAGRILGRYLGQELQRDAAEDLLRTLLCR